MSALECRGLGKRFGGVRALDGVDLAVASGEIVSLLGPSGCGKTTFLRLVAGFERPDAGRVLIGDREMATTTTFVPPERRSVGFVFQDYALFPHLSVADNVAFGVRDRGDAERALALVGLSTHAERYPDQLSGGEQQRVALARALAPSPSVVLLDEPFSNLDADLRARMRRDVREILRAARATAIFVTHDQHEALEIADRVALMFAGRIEQVASPEELYHLPATRMVADFVGEATFLPADVDGTVIVCELGTFPATDVPSGPHQIMVRPEDVVLWSDPSGKGEVIARRFRGPVTMCDVRLESGRTVTAAHASHVLHVPGEHVRVAFQPDHIVLFDGERRTAWIPARAHTGTDRL